MLNPFKPHYLANVAGVIKCELKKKKQSAKYSINFLLLILNEKNFKPIFHEVFKTIINW